MALEDAEGQTDNSENKIVKAESEAAENEKDNSGTEQELRISLNEVRSMMFSGPLPPPDVLAGYDDIIEGGADRLFSMVEKEQAHRLEMKGKLVECQITDTASARRQEGRGQIFALVIGLSIILAGVLMTVLGYAVAGATVITGTLAAGVGAFIIGRTGSKDDEPQLPEEDTKLEK